MHTPEKNQYRYLVLHEHFICLLAGLSEGTPMKLWFKKQVDVIHLQVSEKSYLHKL